MDGSYCLQTQSFYIGGTYSGQFAEHEEYIAHMKHTVELINNKTDGFFDEEMPQAILLLQQLKILYFDSVTPLFRYIFYFKWRTVDVMLK